MQSDPPAGHLIVMLATSAPASLAPLLDALALAEADLLSLPLLLALLLPGPLLDLDSELLLCPASPVVVGELLLEQ